LACVLSWGAEHRWDDPEGMSWWMEVRVLRGGWTASTMEAGLRGLKATRSDTRPVTKSVTRSGHGVRHEVQARAQARGPGTRSGTRSRREVRLQGQARRSGYKVRLRGQARPRLRVRVLWRTKQIEDALSGLSCRPRTRGVLCARRPHETRGRSRAASKLRR